MAWNRNYNLARKAIEAAFWTARLKQSSLSYNF